MEEERAEYDVSERLRLIIKMRGENLRSFSKQTRIPYRTLQNYVSGEMKPNAEQLTKMALAGIDVNYLLTGKTGSISRMIRVDAPVDDSNYRFYADEEIMNAAVNRAKEATNSILREELKEDSVMDFDKLQHLFSVLLGAIIEVIKKADIPFEDARKMGMPVDRLLASVVDVAMQTLAIKIAKQTGAPPE